MEIYQRNSNKTTQWYASTNDQEEIYIMLNTTTPCSISPTDSYPLERNTNTKCKLYPWQAYL